MRDRDEGRTASTAAPGGGRKRLGVLEALRIAWAQLTSMRTALLLLFLLALAAIPGSLVPQRPTAPLKVRDFAAQNPELAVWYDRLGLFDVYGSPWFAAVYLLLFVSLIGCIVPRIAVYAKAVRARPPATPRRLDRLPEWVRGPLAGRRPSEVLDAAEEHLRRRRWRVRRDDDSVSAERGYVREAGNLVFHLSLVVVLVGLAWTSLFGFRGTAVVVVGSGFTNTLTQYDELTAGGAFDPADLEPFTLSLDDFAVEFETGSVQRGAARSFDATVTVRTSAGETQQHLTVNEPLEIGGTEVHLLGHGYAPIVTVRDANGDVAYSGPVVFLPQDGNFTSSGVIKVPDARPYRMAFEGLFLPTGTVDTAGPRSLFPDALVPELVLNAWYGEPVAASGAPENVYTLDTTGLTQYTVDGAPVAMRLSPGDTYDLPGPGGSITFEGYKRWAKIQVSRTPGTWVTLGAVALAVTGLSVSLFVRPRRLWLRVAGGTVVAAGLDKADGRTGLDEDVAELLAAAGVDADDGPDPPPDDGPDPPPDDGPDPPPRET
ncbi:cytochrome c biogenesis protein ResB [Propionicicella superfundia]|uniref:cytochrome c biogenesis protein ResB n=1 Tax=Propionicicella superfundia TaxID=348582 RepID=UPI000427BBB1|nr:cytochrome c biogenesis protein ResB [Propionicicella superfundia]